MKNQKVDKELLETWRTEAAFLEKLEHGVETDFGKTIIQFLDKSIDECTMEEDKKDIYAFTDEARDVFFIAVRSKRQTLRSLRDKLLSAGKMKQQIMSELLLHAE